MQQRVYVVMSVSKPGTAVEVIPCSLEFVAGMAACSSAHPLIDTVQANLLTRCEIVNQKRAGRRVSSSQAALPTTVVLNNGSSIFMKQATVMCSGLGQGLTAFKKQLCT